MERATPIAHSTPKQLRDQRPCRSPKNLFKMPLDVFFRRRKASTLRAQKTATRESDDPLLGAPRWTHKPGNQDALVIPKANGATVERLVVDCAQSQTVVLGVDTAVAMPVHVRRLPVKAGLCDEPSQWLYSSARFR